MPRPIIYRRIFFDPTITYFKPAGVMLKNLSENILTKDELETIRLVDLEEISQSKAAKKMKISQPTLSRILASARKKLADSLINGKAIRIKGGFYKMVSSQRKGLGMGRGMRAGVGQGGRGRMGGFAAGPGGGCKCSKCGTEVQHPIGTPCYQMKCPKCGAKMTRG